jgi:hypothetical protein
MANDPMGMYGQQAAPPAYQQASQAQQSLQSLLNAAGQNLQNMQNRMVNAALDPSIVGQQLQNANAYGLAFNPLDYAASTSCRRAWSRGSARCLSAPSRRRSSSSTPVRRACWY